MTTESIGRELLDLERQYWQALKDHDTATAMRLTDESCIVAGAQGVMTMKRDSLGKMIHA